MGTELSRCGANIGPFWRSRANISTESSRIPTSSAITARAIRVQEILNNTDKPVDEFVSHNI